MLETVKEPSGWEKRRRIVGRGFGLACAIYHRCTPGSRSSEVSDARRLKELEDENRRLKHMVADLSLGKR